MTDLLFVYGSLMPHLRGPYGSAQRSRLAAESTVIGPATLNAELYDLGDYPGITLVAGRSEAIVRGALLRLRNPVATFAWLDPFEDIEPGRDPATELYARVIVSVMCNEVPFETAVYILRRVPPTASKIASGLWHAPSP